jgi:arsenate reductase
MTTEYLQLSNERFLKTLKNLEEGEVEENRKNILDQIVLYAKESLAAHGVCKLIFVCTHNSRRSQMAQAWAFGLSQVYRVPFESYSGGVEETAFHPNAIKALKNQGFIVESETGVNPKVLIQIEKEGESLTCFSKMFDHEANPKNHFAAIKVCDHADANCPYVVGAEERISLNYQDPKRFDDSVNPVLGYEATSLEIGNEMNYIFNKLSQS